MSQQNVQRIDHVVIVVKEENLDDAARSFAELLDIEWENALQREGSGVRFYVNWTAGIEIVAPTDPTGDNAQQYYDFIDKHGEGLFRLVFGVADIEETLARAQSLGYATRKRYSVLEMHPQLSSRFNVLSESIVDPCYGVRLNFGQLELN